MQGQINDFHEMYLAELQELHSVETQLLQALQQAASIAKHPELKRAFESHRQETQQQRIAQILSRHGQQPGEHVDQAMQALLRETQKMAGMLHDPAMRDAALIASAQKVEHYEIAAYGTVATFAEIMGHQEDKRLLGQTLEEEKATDQKLTRIAEQIVNPSAAGDQAGMEQRGG